METEQKYSLWVDHHHRIISFKFMEEYAHLTFLLWMNSWTTPEN